jgi:hypothetical protein
VSFEVQSGAHRAPGTAVDSAAGWFDGDDYRITYDVGRFGERLDRLAEEHGVEPRRLVIAGRPATEVSFAPTDEPFELAHVVQVELGDDRTLTIRVSGSRARTPAIADAVRASIVVE